MSYQPAQQNEPLTIESFELLRVIGKGSFGKVMQVRKKDTGRIYALKTIRKAHIVSRHEVTHTLAERTVLGQVTNPFIVGLKFSFQTTDKLYLGLPYTNGGELFHHLQNEGRFSEERSRFYAAELLCALEHLHSFHVIYRDLKPENILLDYNGHIALCDFGLCKLNMSESDRTNTFCGTPEYLAPEILLAKGYGVQIDWWTLGVLLYEMLAGLPPYYDENHVSAYSETKEHTLTLRLLSPTPLSRRSCTRRSYLNHFGSQAIWAATHGTSCEASSPAIQTNGWASTGPRKSSGTRSLPSTSTGSSYWQRRFNRPSNLASRLLSIPPTLTASSPLKRQQIPSWKTPIYRKPFKIYSQALPIRQARSTLGKAYEATA